MSIKQKDCTTRRHISAAGPLTTRDVYRVLLWGICFLQKQGWCLTLEKSPWNQPCPGRELHGRDMPQFLMPWIFFEMDFLGHAGWICYQTGKSPNLSAARHLRKEPWACCATHSSRSQAAIPASQQGNARPKLTSPTGQTHVDILLESHCYSKQHSFPILALVSPK